MAGRPRKLSPEQEDELVRWWLSPRSCTAMAAKLGISVSTIFEIVARHGHGSGRSYIERKIREYFKSQENRT